MTRKTLIQQQMERIAGKLGGAAPKPATPAPDEPPAPRPGHPGATVTVLEGRKKPLVSREILAAARARIIGDARKELGNKDSLFNPFRMPDFPKSVIESVEATLAMDGALGVVADFGTAQWAAYGNYFYGSAFFEGQTFLGYAYLAQLSQRPEYRKIAERTALDMTRKWIKLIATGDEKTAPKNERIGIIEDELNRLGAKDRFRELIEIDGTFGRAHLFFDFGDEDLNSKELETSIGDGLSSATAIKVTQAHPLKEIRTVEPMWAYPMGYNSTNPLAREWYRPQQWNVMGKMVHRSRLLPIVGREVPDILKPTYAFGGLSLMQMVKPYVDNWLRTRQSVSDILHSFSTNGIKTDMSANTTPGGGAGQALNDRLDLFNLYRDNRGLLILDKTMEEYFQFNAPLGTLDALQAQALEQVPIVVNMPLVVYLGSTPKGLNASSEGEIRVWYDFIEAMQQKLFTDPLTRLINFIQLSKFGNVDPKITFQFEPLWSMTEKERSEVDKNNAEADKTRIESGVLHPVEVRGRIAADPGSPYPALDVEDVPEPPNDGGMGGPGTPDGPGPDGGVEPDGGNAPFEGAKEPPAPRPGD